MHLNFFHAFSLLQGRKTPSQRSKKQANGGGFWSNLFGGPKKDSARPYGEVGTLLVERKVPVKVEPKVFFANERTFLAWLHVSVILAGASVAIVAFADNSDPWSQLYGIILLPVAICFILYSMYMCKFLTERSFCDVDLDALVV
jgi:hypothetical protein